MRLSNATKVSFLGLCRETLRRVARAGHRVPGRPSTARTTRGWGWAAGKAERPSRDLMRVRSHERVELDGAMPAIDGAHRWHAVHRSGVRRGVSWKFLSQAVSLALQLATTVVLARLLTPHDYGLAAMVLIFRRVVMIFSDFALTPALGTAARIDGQGSLDCVLDEHRARHGLHPCRSRPLGGNREPLWGARGRAALYGVLILLPPAFFGRDQAALLTRDLEFRSLEIRNIIGAIVGSVLAVVLAIRGFGPWAIVSQPLATFGTSTILLWLFSAWRPTLAFSAASARGFIGFSSNVFGNQVLTYLTSNLDNFLVGRFLGRLLWVLTGSPTT